MRPCLLLAAAVAAVLPATLGLAADEGPVRKIDVMRIVGRPVLDAESAPEGLYLYLHQGKLHLAAVARKEDLSRGKKSTYQLRLNMDKAPASVQLGAYQRQKQKGSKESWLLTVHVGKRPQTMSFAFDGEVEVSDARVGTGGRTAAAPILLGPLGRRAASSVSLGRY